MATTVDQLIVEIRAETKELRKGLQETNRRLGETGKQAKAALVPLGGFTKLLAAVGGVSLFRGITNTSRQFEDLEATLRAVTGSAENARLAFKTVEEFTATTPFQLANVTEAFIRFFQAGIEPNNENLTAFGNLAAGMGKDITQLAQATFNATTGEMEMLKQFGIKAKLMGDEIEVTFEGQTQTIERTGDAIGQFLLDLGATRFPTALQERLDTLSGSVSNLQDKISIFANQIGQAGLNEALTNLSKGLQDSVDASIGLADILGAVLGGLVNLISGIMNIINVSFDGAVGLFNKIKKEFKELEIFFDQKAEKGGFFGKVLGGLGFGGKTEEQIMQDLQTLADLEKAILDARAGLDKFFTPNNAGTGEAGDTNTGTGSITPPSAEKAKTEVNELATAFEELDTVIAEAGQTLARDFADAILDGKNAMQSLADFSKAIVSEIIATFLNLAVIQPIISSIFSGGTGVGGGPLGASSRPFDFADDQTLVRTPLTLNADMGSMRTNSAGMAPIVVNQSVNFATGIVPTVKAEVTKMLPQIADVSKAAVLEANIRGGTFRRGMR